MVNLVARVLAALALVAFCAYGTGIVSDRWAAGPGHAAEAVSALIVCLVLATASILIGVDVALELHDERTLRGELEEQRRVLDRLSTIG
jgi:TRAP-type C4-dicarboxylate transport system permease small subunit